jgi:hypothetical protein
MTRPPITVSDIGSFHVGGRVIRLEGLPLRERVSTQGGPVHHVDPNGEIIAGQMYVQYIRLAAPKAAGPLLMWHGGGMTGANWEATPDGRPGWQMAFLRAGCDTYVSDAVERAAPPSPLSHRFIPTSRISARPRSYGRRRSASARPARGTRTPYAAAPIQAYVFRSIPSTPSLPALSRAGGATMR